VDISSGNEVQISTTKQPSWVAAGTLSWAGLSIPLYSGMSSGAGAPTFGTFPGSISVTAIDYWTYGGKYDSSTGDFV
jgi:hypothetical protein